MQNSSNAGPLQLRWHARPHRRRIAILATLSFGSGALEAAFLVVATRLGLAVAGDESAILLWSNRSASIRTGIWIGGFLIAMRLILALGGITVSTRLAELVTMAQRIRLSDAYFTAAWPARESEPTGRLQQMLITFTQQVTILSNSLGHGVTAAVSLTALIGFSLFVDATATLIVLGSLAVLLIALLPIRRAVSRRASTATSVQVEFAENVAELGSVGLELHSFGAVESVRLALSAQASKEARVRRQVETLVQSVTPLYISLAYALVLFAVVSAFQSGPGTLQSFGPVLLIMLRSLGYGQQIQTTMAEVQNQLPVLGQIEDSIERFSLNPAITGIKSVEEIDRVTFRKVDFEYTEGRPILAGVSFEIRRGEVIGVIGPSGSGKSTLIQLLLGVREPTSGTISIGDHDLSTVKRSDLTRLIGFVPQSPTILSASVRDNILFFRKEVPEGRVAEALSRAHFSAEVAEMAEGLDTFVGERGSSISGGQRQRLSIARAVLYSPELLILDEPTSSLDSESELAVRASLREIAVDSTVVIVAHRLSTLEICHRIMIIRDQGVEAFDTPQKLRESNDYFASVSRSGVLS